MDCLVLNPYNQPLGQVNWERAITLLWLGLVEVLQEYEDWTVRGASRSWKVPSVVRYLTRGTTALRRRSVRFSRENVYARDKGKCQYCGGAVPRDEMTFEHVIPRDRGGRTRWDNVVTACWPCNQKKRNRTPTEAKMPLRVKPTAPTSIHGAVRLSLTKERLVRWREYLRDVAYWNSELESD